MEREERPIIVVYEKPVNFVLHDGRIGGELGLNKGNFHRLAVLIHSLVGDLAGLGLPNP